MSECREGAVANASIAASIEAGEGGRREGMSEHAARMPFPIGEPNVAFADHFTGKSYLARIDTDRMGMFNVTFEPGCRNDWHVHRAASGGGQILICVAGRGFFQERGKEAVEMGPGDCIDVAPGVQHWHGAAPDSWFSHLAIEVPGDSCSNEWLEPVSEEQYLAAVEPGSKPVA